MFEPQEIRGLEPSGWDLYLDMNAETGRYQLDSYVETIDGSVMRLRGNSVHGGFLTAWTTAANCVEEALTHYFDDDQWETMLVTGHSLGGAITR